MVFEDIEYKDNNKILTWMLRWLDNGSELQFVHWINPNVSRGKDASKFKVAQPSSKQELECLPYQYRQARSSVDVVISG